MTVFAVTRLRAFDPSRALLTGVALVSHPFREREKGRVELMQDSIRQMLCLMGNDIHIGFIICY